MNNFAVKVGEGFCFGLGFVLIAGVMSKLFGLGIC